jgi:hypothetical protein
MGSAHAQVLLDGEFSFTQLELGPVRQRIRDALGGVSIGLDSPVRLQEALAALIGSTRGTPTVTVRRSPAALLTPEYWRIQLRGVDRDALDALSRLLRNDAR